MASRERSAVGGWLLLLCLLLLVWHPLRVALSASTVMSALAVRGWPFALGLAARVGVAAVGIAAGIALTNLRPAAVGLARLALVLSAAMDLVIYLTSIFPNNRMPGDTPLYLAGSILYHGTWLVYLARSARVRRAFSGPP
jgi:hypothetical protein